MPLLRCSAPISVQFELTYRCNCDCFFCYTHLGPPPTEELATGEILGILHELKTAGVHSVNFNGGEPLLREDFVEIAGNACRLGLDLHLNTNGTLLSDSLASDLQDLLPSVCVSLLDPTPSGHDRLVGYDGAFHKTIKGIQILRRHGIAVEVNTAASALNFEHLDDIARIAVENGATAFLVTRYVVTSDRYAHLALNTRQTLAMLRSLRDIEATLPGLERISLPGPIPLCAVPSDLRDCLRRWNVQCSVGFGMCRIDPAGNVSPCTILAAPVFGNLRNQSFHEIWTSAEWERFVQCDHLPERCMSCESLAECRGGCPGYRHALAGLTTVSREHASEVQYE